MNLALKFSFILISILWVDDLISQDIILDLFMNGHAEDISMNHTKVFEIGNVEATEDRYGNTCGALHFDGKGSYLSIPNSITFNRINNSFTLTCWFNLDASCVINSNKWLTILCKGGSYAENLSSPHFRIQAFQSGSQATFSLCTEFTEYDLNYYNHAIINDKWTFFAVTFDGSLVSAYFNDQLIWKYPFSGSLIANQDSLYIGQDRPGNQEYFCGSLDDLKLFSSALSQSEILNEYYSNDDSGPEEIELLCGDNLRVASEVGKCGAKVFFQLPELKVNCGQANLIQTAGKPPGDYFEVGTNKIRFEAIAESGFKRACFNTILVEDHEIPTIKCLRDTILYIKDNKETIKYDFSNPICSDNCGIKSLILSKGFPSGSEFKIGTTLQEFKAIDYSGNIALCNWNVDVRKEVSSIPRVLDCPTDIKKNNDTNKCGAIVNYTLPSPNDKVSLISGLSSGSTFPVGGTNNILEERFGDFASSQCSFNIYVMDVEKPVLVCPNDIIEYLGKGEVNKKVRFKKIDAYDNCYISSVKQLIGHPSDYSFIKGETINLFEARDSSGNISTCSFKITLVDTNGYKQVLLPKDKDKAVIPDSIVLVGEYVPKDCKVTISMYDDGIQDSDTISVFYNGYEIVVKELIKLKKNGIIIRDLKLDSGKDNKLIVKSWNNGGVSPNTMRMDFFIGEVVDKNALNYIKPNDFKLFHSKPGFSEAINLRCE